jgi:hypothetical protein
LFNIAADALWRGQGRHREFFNELYPPGVAWLLKRTPGGLNETFGNREENMPGNFLTGFKQG